MVINFQWLRDMFTFKVSETIEIPNKPTSTVKEEIEHNIAKNDIVTIGINGVERQCIVLELTTYDRAWLRRLGKTTAGRQYPKFVKQIRYLKLYRKYDPLTANVFADFLEENGYTEAAELLRNKFPLGDK